MRHLLRSLGWFAAGTVLLLIGATVTTARFGNAALYPPHGDDARIELFVVSHGYHAGLVVPRAAIADIAKRQKLSALAAAVARFGAYPRIEIGWGDEDFYMQVPAVASLTLATALRALFTSGNPAVLHVVGLPIHPRAAFPSAEIVVLILSERGFARLAATIDEAFAREENSGEIEDLGRGLYGPSLFFRATGTFSLLKVCNHWVADLLDAAGVPTAPVLATWPAGLLWDLSWRAGAVRLPRSVSS